MTKEKVDILASCPLAGGRLVPLERCLKCGFSSYGIHCTIYNKHVPAIVCALCEAEHGRRTCPMDAVRTGRKKPEELASYQLYCTYPHPLHTVKAVTGNGELHKLCRKEEEAPSG